MWVVLLLSFLTGFAVMQIELVAPHLVTPLLGSTNLTWSAVFAVFLGALALGNAVGGVISDRGGRRTLGMMFLAVLMTVGPIVGLAGWLGTGVLDGLPHGMRTIVVVLVLFGPAAFALGLIGPSLARAALAHGTTPGRALGAVAAAGALGSVAGTLATGLWLLGTVPSVAILWVSFLLVLVAWGLAWLLPTDRVRTSSERGGSTPRRWLLLAALAGAALLIVEIVAGRLAARRLGTSMYTWTSIIATVLLGLAIGNAIGGRLADREGRQKLLGTLFVVASGVVAACLWTPRLISLVAGPSALPWPLLVFLACAVGFLLPAIALGTLSPVILRAALADPASDGRVAGRVYAAGTVGAVAGSLLAGYVLLPALGASLLFVLLAFALALVGCWLHRRVEVAWLLTLIAIGFVIAAPMDSVADLGRRMGLRPAKDLYVEDSRYFHITVGSHNRRWVPVPDFDDLRQRMPLPSFEGRLTFDERRGRIHWVGPMTVEERTQLADILGPSNASAAPILFDRVQTKMRRLALDGFVHGYSDLGDPDWLEYDYEVLYDALVRALRPRDERMSCFFIGGGCYTFQRHLLRQRSAPLKLVSAELDPAVTRVAQELLGLRDDPRHVIHHDDARTVLRNSDLTYDLIFGDAFHDLAVPWHLTTHEFAQTVKDKLEPDGVYLVNMIDMYSSGRFLRAFLDTLSDVFPYVRVMSMAPRDDNAQETFLVVASGTALRFGPLTDVTDKALPVTEYTDADLEALRTRQPKLILRDGYAPVEHLLAPVVKRRGAIIRSR